MVSDVLNYWISTNSEGLYVDATGGDGGHSYALLEALSQQKNNSDLLILDRDSDALKRMQKRLEKFSNRIRYIKSDFRFLSNYVKANSICGLLLDLGMSSYQLDCPERGFSYRLDGKLDMRMDNDISLTAYEIINNWSEEKIREILYSFGEEKKSPLIAKQIVNARKLKPISNTLELTDILHPILSKKYFNKILSRIFQALRITINEELAYLRII